MGCAPFLLAGMLLLAGCALPTRGPPRAAAPPQAAAIPPEPLPDGMTPLTVEQDRELGDAPARLAPH